MHRYRIIINTRNGLERYYVYADNEKKAFVKANNCTFKGGEGVFVPSQVTFGEHGVLNR